MSSLPYVTEGLDLPPKQPMVPGQANGYVGIYVADAEPRIVMTLSYPLMKFGTVENWAPIFECAFPIVIAASEKKERFFQIRFIGVPGEREKFVSGKLCVRSVQVVSIQKMFEGENPPMVR
ncbi:MAG: hypothetical protein ABI273_09090 [Lacunisphaera sp.]